MKFLEVTDSRDGKTRLLPVPKGWTAEQFKKDIKQAYVWLKVGEIKEEKENGEPGERPLQLRG